MQRKQGDSLCCPTVFSLVHQDMRSSDVLPFQVSLLSMRHWTIIYWLTKIQRSFHAVSDERVCTQKEQGKDPFELVLMNTLGMVSYEVSSLLTPNSFLTPFCLWPNSVKR